MMMMMIEDDDDDDVSCPSILYTYLTHLEPNGSAASKRSSLGQTLMTMMICYNIYMLASLSFRSPYKCPSFFLPIVLVTTTCQGDMEKDQHTIHIALIKGIDNYITYGSVISSQPAYLRLSGPDLDRSCNQALLAFLVTQLKLMTDMTKQRNQP